MRSRDAPPRPSPSVHWATISVNPERKSEERTTRRKQGRRDGESISALKALAFFHPCLCTYTVFRTTYTIRLYFSQFPGIYAFPFIVPPPPQPCVAFLVRDRFGSSRDDANYRARSDKKSNDSTERTPLNRVFETYLYLAISSLCFSSTSQRLCVDAEGFISQ